MDSDLLEELYHRYYGSSLLYCVSLCGNVHMAEDILADAFVKAYLSLPNDVPSFRFWLLKVCKNLWIDHLRRHKHLTTEEPLQYIADPATPETVYLKKEQQKALWAAIGELSPGDRELLTLHYFAGLPLSEIALFLGVSHDAVRQRLSRMRKKLKQRMEEQGYGKL